MKEIVLTRIDDRLIHGQVMTSWLNYTSANKIVIIDDALVSDMFMKNILASCLPANIALEIMNVEDASTRFLDGFDQKDKIIVLTKSPKTILELMENGVKFEKLNVGGMGANASRKKFYKNISASAEEKEAFKKIITLGCSTTIQIIAEDKAYDVSKLL